MILLLDEGTVLFGRHHVFNHRWYLERKKNRDLHAGRRGTSCSSVAEGWQMCSEHCSASRSRSKAKLGEGISANPEL